MRAPAVFVSSGLLALGAVACASRAPDGARQERLRPPPAARVSEEGTPASSRIAAEVDGQVITTEALDARFASEDELQSEIDGAEPRLIHMAKRAVLERMIDEAILEKEAQRRGLSRQALEESLTKDVVVSDQEVDAAIERAKAYKGGNTILERRTQRLLAGSESKVRERMHAFVLLEKQRLKVREFALALRKHASIAIHLPEAPAQRGKS